MWIWQSDYHIDGDIRELPPLYLVFDRMSDSLMLGMDWTDNEVQAALNLLLTNTLKLKEFLAALVSSITFDQTL